MASGEKAPVKMKLLDEFLSISTIHGSAQISQANSLLLKSAWVAIVTLCFGFAVFLISSSYTDWNKSPVSSVTTTRPISDLQFPDVTVCPPRGSNTVLNHVLDQVTDEKVTPGLREHLRDTVMEIFMEKPSRMFATDMAHLINIHTLKNLEEEGAMAVKKNITSISIEPTLPEGIISTPGFSDPEYKGDFFKSSHSVHFHLDVSLVLKHLPDVKDISIVVETDSDSEWMMSKQREKLKLYRKKLTFTDAEAFCLNLGGHLVSVESPEKNAQVFNKSEREWVWLGGTDTAEEGDWIWKDGKAWKFTSWANHQPDDKTGDEDCVYLKTETDLPKWYNEPCSWLLFFLCQIEPTSVTGPKRLVLRNEEWSTIDIWWNYDSTSEVKIGSPGIHISWTIQNDFQEGQESLIPSRDQKGMLEFWNKTRLELEYFAFPNMSWHQAEAFCAEKGGHLASIDSQYEQDQLIDLLKHQSVTAWLGGSDEAVESQWTWIDGSPWVEEHWDVENSEPEGLRGENCLVVWRDHYRWADVDCDDQFANVQGFVCRLPTEQTTFWKVFQLVVESKQYGFGRKELWRAVLRNRWTMDSLKRTQGKHFCLDIPQQISVIEKTNQNLKMKSIGRKDIWGSDDDLPLVIEIFSLLHYCPPPQLVQSVKLGILFGKLLVEESMKTLVLTVMNNLKNNFSNNSLVDEFFVELDKVYKFKLGPTVLALATTAQLRQMTKKKIPFLKAFSHQIERCLEGVDCTPLMNIIQSSGGYYWQYSITFSIRCGFFFGESSSTPLGF